MTNMDKIKKLAKELSQEIRSIEERGGFVWGTFLTSNMIEDYFFKKIADTLAERDFRIKRLEREKNDVAIELHDAIMREARTYSELSRIKEGAEKLPFVTVQREHIDMRTGIANVIFKSDLDKLMKGGE